YHEAALNALRLRFRPIIMTSLAFILGVLPLAIATGASEASRPAIGTVVIGGMLAATFLATMFVPMFCEIIERMSDWVTDRNRKRDAYEVDTETPAREQGTEDRDEAKSQGSPTAYRPLRGGGRFERLAGVGLCAGAGLSASGPGSAGWRAGGAAAT